MPDAPLSGPDRSGADTRVAPQQCIRYRASKRALVVDFVRPQRALSWALVGGGLRQTLAVVWCEVRNAELGRDVDAADLLRRRLHAVERPAAVGLLTSASLTHFRHSAHSIGDLRVECVATAGFGNALCVGDPPSSGAAGTINVLCQVSQPLSRNALLESLSIVAEARTVATQQQNRLSIISGKPATGTGTDCIVICCESFGPELSFAGKHTALGCLLGRATLDALSAL